MKKRFALPLIFGGLLVVAALPNVEGSQSAKDAAKRAAAPKTEISAESAKLLAAAKEKDNAIRKQHAEERAAADAKFKAEGWFQLV